LFESVKEMLEYLEKNPLLEDCHITVLAEHGRYQEAADIHERGGRFVEAIVTLFKDRENETSKRRANDCILQRLWESTSFSQRIKETDTAAQKLLQLASKVAKDTTLLSLLSPTQKDEASSELPHSIEFATYFIYVLFDSWNCFRACANLTTRLSSDSSRTVSSVDRRTFKQCYASIIILSNFRQLRGSPTHNLSKF
jgi:hypothetical protein